MLVSSSPQAAKRAILQLFENTGVLFSCHPIGLNMTYPKPVPAFTQEAFDETMERVEQATVPEEEVAAVAELRAELQADSDE